MLPLLEQVLLRARQEVHLSFETASEAVGRYLDLLIGDQQIRRVIGQLPPPTAESCQARSQRAVALLRHLLSDQLPADGTPVETA